MFHAAGSEKKQAAKSEDHTMTQTEPLVYNPRGTSKPPSNAELEKEAREIVNSQEAATGLRACRVRRAKARSCATARGMHGDEAQENHNWSKLQKVLRCGS